jgi:hypothetical protein
MYNHPFHHRWGLTFDRIGFTVDGTHKGTYTIVGPDYEGELSSTVLQAPTTGVWILGRIAVIYENSTDIAIANALMKEFNVSAPAGFTLDPLSSPIYETTIEVSSASHMKSCTCISPDHETTTGGCGTSASFHQYFPPLTTLYFTVCLQRHTLTGVISPPLLPPHNPRFGLPTLQWPPTMRPTARSSPTWSLLNLWV